ncbi:hypothetical protein HMPREF9503_02448 [Enterococcus faecalis TX0043]|nr:hypothetical protein HMPREF9503_02448 [Enterococcus faecalis TX0043]
MNFWMYLLFSSIFLLYRDTFFRLPFLKKSQHLFFMLLATVKFQSFNNKSAYFFFLCLTQMSTQYLVFFH